MDITLKDIESFDQRFRTTFVNSLGGFKSLALIGTRSLSGNSNLAVFNSLFHLGAHPPLLGFIIRPDSVDRHTLSNIRDTKAFTINHVNESIYFNAHQTSARYPAEISEFKETGLGEIYLGEHYAPFVKESNIQIAAELTEIIPIRMNGTVMVTGSITRVHLPAQALGADGFVDLAKAGSITCAGLDAYYKTELLNRLSYAKPGSRPALL